MPFFYTLDVYYWIILIPAFLVALAAQIRVSTTFSRYQKVGNRRGYTGYMAAQMVLQAHGVQGVRIERVRGSLTDHYDPRSNVIRLSESVYDSTSVAAVGVAAHEAGHAVQYAVGYGPIKVRNMVIPVSSIGSQLGFVLLIAGIFFGSELLFGLGVVFFGAILVFQLVTLPVEFNASNRALETLGSTHMLEDEELTGAQRVLTAAAMTYVAALLVSMAQLLRYILLFSNSNRRER